jgi:phosphoribosyl 1,2-cyclic phosphate phosphodiesterase
MKVTFLGTGTSQGIPVITCDCSVCKSDNLKDNRLRTSVLVEVDNQTMVIDTGPDFRQQMLRENIQKLDAVLFTHEHKDHIAGLDDVRAFNFKQKREMEIYASENVIKALKREFYYAFEDEKYPGVPQLSIKKIDNETFNVNNTQVIPIEVMHYKMQVFGFRINNFAYITDAKTISEAELQKLKNLDVLVLNALRKTEHISHLNLQEAVEWAERISPKKTYLTHISHLMGKHNEVSSELPENVEIAYDGLKLFL